MKSLTLLFLVLSFGTSLLRAEDKLPKENITFDGRTYYLADIEKSTDEIIKKYIPKDEDLKSWTHMLSIRTYPHFQDAMGIAMNITERVQRQNPQAATSLQQNPTTHNVMIDFLTWTKTYADYNVFKFVKKPEGLVAYQCAVRDYKDIEAFKKNINPTHQRLLTLMATDDLKINP